MLSPPSAEKFDVPMRCKGKGVSSDPVVLETPPQTHVMGGSSSTMPSRQPVMSTGKDFLDAAAILDEMQLNQGLWDQYQSQIVEEDGKAVALGNDEDSEAILWDSEVYLLDSPRSWTTEDAFNDMMYDDSGPMFGNDNRSPNLNFDFNESPKSPIGTFDLNLDVSPRENYSPPPPNNVEQQLIDEMYNDRQPMFGSFSTPEATQNATNIPDLNAHTEEINEHPTDMNEEQEDIQGQEAGVDSEQEDVFVEDSQLDGQTL
ncbi:hypothetical protein FRX31_030548 [Thalictrum thalictroides]|uniref:Uncharacterized protein n=1 Tax=Thalictrum thalictroides TaxID=46969 RepID=A0A7J6V4H3_THATH|nr:hypothetical protein FRX31_030548 [Thalictrum thalictroides]